MQNLMINPNAALFPLFTSGAPTSGEGSTLAPSPPMQVALFGTSADPPTIAHQKIISWLASQFIGDASPQEIRVAVWAADNPFKTHGASLAQRSQMLELLISEIDPAISRHVKVYPELSSRRTFETLINAQKVWHDAEFVLVVGADLIAQLPQWYQAQALLAQVKLLIVPRIGNEIEQSSLDKLVELGAKISIAPLATPAISSTIIRTNRAVHHESIQGLTPAVSAYIQQQGLYELRVES